MANLSITRRCDRDCAYCFAAHERDGEPLDMPPDVYERALDFLARSGVPDARLLGGEPTLHPAFETFCDRALGHGFALTVMTGGLAPEASVRYLASLPSRHMSVYLNAAVPGVDADELVSAQERLCAALGERVELGVTLVAGKTDLGFLLDWIERYGLRRSVRVGIAQPVLGGGNASVASAQVRALGETIERFVRRAETAGVTVGFDCGITPCLFSAPFAQKHPEVMATVGTRCGPVVDVLPDGDVVACYALSRVARVPLLDDATRDGLIETFSARLDRDLGAGHLFAECARCAHRRAGACTGGCRARIAAKGA